MKSASENNSLKRCHMTEEERKQIGRVMILLGVSIIFLAVCVVYLLYTVGQLSESVMLILEFSPPLNQTGN